MIGKIRRSVRLALPAVLLAAASAAALRADEPPPFKTLVPGQLKVCLYAGFAPFASQDADGKWQGWDVDYLQEFAKQNGLDFVVVPKDFEGIWLEPGKPNAACDIAGTGISDTKARRQATGSKAVWSNTYYGVLRTFLVRTQDFTKLTKVEDLRGKKAIVTQGSTANSDLCYRMKEKGIHPCQKNAADNFNPPPDKLPADHPCAQFPGLDLAQFPETLREQDPTCVYIEYPWAQDEKNAASDISVGRISDPDPTFPFTYGGGYGSIQDLVCNCQGATGKGCAAAPRTAQDLATVWPHCNMTQEGPVAEPFSFVVRSADTGLAHALNCYINSHKYAGTPIPIPDPPCAKPSWVPPPDTNCPAS